MDSEPASCVSPSEVHQHTSGDKDSEKGRSRKPSFSMPRLALPKIKTSKGQAGLRQGDINASLPSATAGGDLVVTQTAISDHSDGATGPKDVTTGEFMSIHVRSSFMPGEETQSNTEVPKYDLAVGGVSKDSVFGGLSSIQYHGELTSPIAEDPLQLSVGQRDDALSMESPEEGPTARAKPADSHEGWFRMPKFRLPGFRRSSSKERDEAGEEANTQTHMPVASTPLEAEAAASASVQLSHDSGSKVEAHVSAVLPEDGASVRFPGSPTYADIVRRDLQGTGSRQPHPTVGMSQTYLPTPEFRTLLAMSAVRLSEPQIPPDGTGQQPQSGPGGHHLAEVEGRAGTQPSQPEGPLKLRVSCTDIRSQVSMVSTRQLWEDSVLTVTFPKLKVPRFSFPAPSSETDVFFPVVREVQCVEASIGSALGKDGPGLWEASLLKTDIEDPSRHPVNLEQSLEVPPVSKVRVHIQGDQGRNQEATICSRVTQEGADPAVPGTFSTQIVRESEIPVSTVQTPSYGFSLLKVKIPEPLVQASMCAVAQDPRAQEGLDGAPMPPCVEVDSAPGDVQPDAGEPFEMISASAVPSGPQIADSTSDEEPAEILEFPEDNQEVNTPDLTTKDKPEGKKSSLLWSWLPSIGFSSVEEPGADSRDTAPKSDPIHTQPEARLDPELPRKQEKAGWFRFPKLGFSSSLTKRNRSTTEEGQAGHKIQEETVTFFDARESFSPEEEEEEEEEEEGEPGSDSRAMVTSSARTELILLEQDRNTSDKTAPRSVAK
uniref:Protein AHNAK2 n=1 Tax=Nannospalax galili TaxID=1026970 RepID=A0A8C6RQU0_NANGA